MAQCHVKKTGFSAVDTLVSTPSLSQSTASFAATFTASNTNTVMESCIPGNKPAKSFVDMVLSATSSPISVTMPPSSPAAAIIRHSNDATNKVGQADVPVCTSLSPLAQVWIPTSNTIVRNLDLLYPPGINSAGIEFEVSDDAWVALQSEYKSSQEFELPAEAIPDLLKTARLVDNKVALPNGTVFLDKVLPKSAFNTVEDTI